MLWNYDRRVLAVLALFVLGTISELSTLFSSWRWWINLLSPQLPVVQILAFTCTLLSSLLIEDFKMAPA